MRAIARKRARKRDADGSEVGKFYTITILL